MKNFKKNFTTPLLIIIIALFIICGGTYIYSKNHRITSQSLNDSVAGKKFISGQNIPIKWNSTEYSHVIVMAVAGKADKWSDYTNNGSMATYRGYVIYNGPNKGFIDWTVPNYQTAGIDTGDYLIRLEFEDGTVIYSNDFFSIKN